MHSLLTAGLLATHFSLVAQRGPFAWTKRLPKDHESSTRHFKASCSIVKSVTASTSPRPMPVRQPNIIQSFTSSMA